MNAETRLKLNKFQPREYQKPIFDALERGFKRVLCILPRRAGKDVVGFNWVIRCALKKIGVYYYIFPTFAQGKRVLWDSITNTGEKFLDYIPAEIVASKNSQEQKIILTNGSLIQVVGSDNIDALMGTNPQGCVFSEYALQTPVAYQLLRPILLANNGWALFLSTPRGKNHMYDLYQIALNSPEWFVYRLTLNETKHISLEAIEKEREEGLMSDILIEQEYNCSFEQGQEGLVYGKYIDRMRINGQITAVPWEPGFKVHCAMDLGIGKDNFTILFFQVIGKTIHIIDAYENHGWGLDHYVKIIQQKEYKYGKFFAPHDIRVKELGTGVSRLESARRLGLALDIAPELSLEDGLEAVRAATTKLWIDDKKCKDLIKDMETYAYEWDEVRSRYKYGKPAHRHDSHMCDALRYLCLSLNKVRDGLTPEERNKQFEKAVYGGEQLPPFFRDGGMRM